MTTTKRQTEPHSALQSVPVSHPQRNPGIPLDMDWVSRVRINRSAVERRAATMSTRRTVKKEWQVAWLLRAIACIDLTTLAGDDTPGNVLRLCAKARQPVRQDLLAALGADGFDLKAGAGEIDIVISRAHVLTGNWQALYDEVRTFRAACGAAHMKTILATHELATFRNVGMSSLVCMMAGADFIKTSTGKEAVNATIPVGVVMARAIRDYYEQTGYKVGFKPAGGIRSAKESLDWLILMKEELGNEWLNNTLFRIGASGLLSDIERQLSYFVTGHYAAAHHNPMV